VTDLRPELGRITEPVTVLYAVPEGMPVTPEQFDTLMRELYGSITDAQFVRIDDSNHFIQIDQPARFAAEVDAFMH
jgi:pimeloyl-ACP methyl ester carboxylesterase